MKKEEEKQTIYYSDELNDEFSGIKKEEIIIDKDYKYVHNNPFWKIAEWVVYSAVFLFGKIYCKVKLNLKIENRKVLKKYKNKGFYLYGNHTNTPGDGFFPSVITYGKKPYVIANAQNVSTKGTQNIMMMLGVVPIPNKVNGFKNFTKTIQKRYNEGHPIMIYPEAHIWPYYTKIRPFTSVSFKYPVEQDAPVFCFTTTYQKRKNKKEPQVVSYIDGPFYKDENLSNKENQELLRNQVYNAMVERSQNNNFEKIKYVKIEGEKENGKCNVLWK